MSLGPTFGLLPCPSLTDLGIWGWLKSLSTTIPWIRQVSWSKSARWKKTIKQKNTCWKSLETNVSKFKVIEIWNVGHVTMSSSHRPQNIPTLKTVLQFATNFALNLSATWTSHAIIYSPTIYCSCWKMPIFPWWIFLCHVGWPASILYKWQSSTFLSKYKCQ